MRNSWIYVATLPRAEARRQLIDHVTARLSEILGDARVGFASVE
jgi:hypothetical protein